MTMSLRFLVRRDMHTVRTEKERSLLVPSWIFLSMAVVGWPTLVVARRLEHCLAPLAIQPPRLSRATASSNFGLDGKNKAAPRDRFALGQEQRPAFLYFAQYCKNTKIRLPPSAPWAHQSHQELNMHATQQMKFWIDNVFFSELMI